MKKLILSVIFILVSAASATPTSLSDAGFLRKASLRIRGLMPSPEEYRQLKALSDPAERAIFLQQKISEYLASPEAEDRMVFRLSERFQVRTPEIDLSTLNKIPAEQRTTISPGAGARDSMTDLFARLSRENLSWDYLLTGHDYNAFARSNDLFRAGDHMFFRALFPNLPESPNGTYDSSNETAPAPIPLKFEPDDLRVSGVLTTPRFLSRYVTTNINKNRRRAAAVFRIFLCDPMFPIIPPPPDRKSAVLATAFSDDVHSGMIDMKLGQKLDAMIKMGDAQRHGSDPRCMACHYKLDPMGRVFQNIGLALSPSPAPGKLTYARANTNEKIAIPLRGVGDLGQALVQQPEYVSCQIDWFWKEFIGSDIPLSTERKADLTTQFEAVGRRTNDFIRTLVNAPEFRTKPQVSETISFPQVQNLLKRCDTCHASEGYIPSFYDGRLSHKTLLGMRHRLNLPDGHKDKMPRDWMKWDVKDLNTVKMWLEQGAISDSNQPQLTPVDLKESP